MAENDQFDTVEMIATDTSSSSEESEFSGVIFNNVRECYPPNQDIECRYTIKPSVKPTRRDWVGLFKVGWHSSNEQYTFEWSPLLEHSGDEVPLVNRVVFRGNYLPNAEDEFYQFCYVTNARDIRGASVPFQIKTKVAELELVCCEMEDGECSSMLLVNTKTAVLEDSLSRALEENAIMKGAKATCEVDLAAADEKIMDLEIGKADLTRQLKDNEEIVISAKKEVEIFHKALKQKTEELEEENSQRTELETLLAEEQSQRKDISVMLNNANLTVQELSKILEQERNESSEAVKNKEKLVTEKMQFLESVAVDKEMLQKCRANLKVKDEEVNSLKARLSETRAKAKAEVGNLSASLDIANERVTLIQEELAKERSTCDNLKRSTEMEIDKQSKKVRYLQNELRSKEQQLLVAVDGQALQFAELQQTSKETQEKAKKEFSAISRMLKSAQEEAKEKQELIHRLADDVQELQEQLDMAKDKNTALEEDYESTLRALENQLDGQKALNESLCCQSDNNLIHLQTELQRQLEVNADLSHRLEAKTTEAKQLEKVLEGYNKGLDESEAKVQRAWIQLSAADATVRDLTTEKEVLQTKLSDSKVESSKQSKNSGASMFALQTAQTHLEKKLVETDREKQNLWRERNDLKRMLATFQGNLSADDLRHQIEDLRAHNEDLRVRLNMGAEAYKMKFIECRKLQSQLKKCQKSISSESIDTSMNADVQSVVSKLRQALDSERELVASTKLALEREKEAMLKKDLELVQFQEEAFLMKETVGIVQNQLVQQSSVESVAEELQIKVVQLQAELENRGAKLVEVERDLQTEKCEKETINHEMRYHKEQLKESNWKFEEEHQALCVAQAKTESLEQQARQMLQDRFDSEEELQGKIRKLVEQVERWKKEVDMHVEAQAKLIGASSPEQQATAQRGQPWPQPQPPQPQSPPPPQQGLSPQNRPSFSHDWMRGLFPSGPAPGMWANQPWVMVNAPNNQEGRPPPEAPPAMMQQAPPAMMQQAPPQPTPADTPWVGDRECPVCKLLFPPNVLLTAFEEHVNAHFRD